MKLLVLDTKTSHALDFVMRARRDGHDVRWFVPENEQNKHIGEGMAPIVREFEPSVRWADLIFMTDNTHHVRQMDAARNYGIAVIGPSYEMAQWELDRTYGMEMLEGHGIAVPQYEEFNSYDQAIAYVKKHDRPFVSKPSGDADKALSYVSKSPADLVYMLERWKKSGKLKPPFILQEKIDGIEMAVGGWFGPHGWNKGWCENFEFKKLCNGDLGCATGEQGTVLRYVRKSKLARRMIEPLTDTLAAKHYVGYIDVNTIIDERGQAWPLEFTMRPGWPTFNIQQELHHGDAVEWLAGLADGVDAGNVKLDTVAAGVVMSIPDYPYSKMTRKEVTGIPIYGTTHELWEHIHPCEMMQATAPDSETMKPVPMPATAGDYVLVMSGKADTVRGATRLVYDRLKQITVPNSPMYRTDIGDRLRKQLPQLQSHGYAMGMNYAAKPPAHSTKAVRPVQELPVAIDN